MKRLIPALLATILAFAGVSSIPGAASASPIVKPNSSDWKCC